MRIPVLTRSREKQVLKFKEGESNAFSELYNVFRRPIMGYVFRRTRDRAVAEELTQEVFLKAYRAREQFNVKFEFSTWIWSIAKNTVTDWLRGSRGANLNSEIEIHEIASDEPDADVHLIQQEKRRGLMSVLGKLTHAQKQVVMLRVVRGLSYDSIAAQLGLSLSAVKCLMHRARATISKSIGSNELAWEISS